LGPDDLKVAGPRPPPPQAFSGPGNRGPSVPEPMEVDEPDPLGRVYTIQCPMYNISEVLHDAKTRYPEVHQLLYALLNASRKLRHYFKAHKSSVVTSYPLKVVLHNPNATGNITNWVAELAEFKLDFLPRDVVKS
jgi:hypothetical protein